MLLLFVPVSVSVAVCVVSVWPPLFVVPLVLAEVMVEFQNPDMLVILLLIDQVESVTPVRMESEVVVAVTVEVELDIDVPDMEPEEAVVLDTRVN